MCYPHVRCRSVAISWVQGRGLSRPWYIGLGLWPNPWRRLGHCSSLVFLCLPIFAKRLASPGPVSGPRSLQIPLMAPEAKWIMIVTGLCFLFWSIELSRDNQRHTPITALLLWSVDTPDVPPVSGDIMVTAPWVTSRQHWPLAPLSRPGQSILTIFPTFIRLEILMRTSMSHRQLKLKQTRLPCSCLMTENHTMIQIKTLYDFRLSLLKSRKKHFTKVSTLNFEIHERTWFLLLVQWT